jgi:hypothetical protein
MDADGDFVVVWQSNYQDGSSWGIYGQRYNASGVAQGSEFRVSTYTTGQQFIPSIAMDAGGDFVASGVAQGSEFRVNTHTTNAQNIPSVAMDDSGDFVIAWQSLGQDAANTYGVYAQRYNSSGTAQGSEFLVNTYTTSNQAGASVAMDSNGDFVIAWWSDGQDGSSGGIYAQRYNSSGTAQGSEFLVNTYTNESQGSPAVAMSSDGEFVITWQSNDQDGSSAGIYAQRYNSSGTAHGSEFRVNTYTTNLQLSPKVAMDDSGNFVVTWTSYDQDGDGYGAFARRWFG